MSNEEDVLIVLVGLMAFAGVMLYLGTYRVGNRVRITGGDHDGKDAVVTEYHGLTTRDWVRVTTLIANDWRLQYRHLNYERSAYGRTSFDGIVRRKSDEQAHAREAAAASSMKSASHAPPA